MTISEQIATYLSSQSIFNYDEDSVDSETLLDRIHDKQHSLGIYTKPSRTGDDKNSINIVGIQTLVRGSKNPIESQGYAKQVFDALNCYRGKPFVANENYIIRCITKNGDPVCLGMSENGFFDYSITFEVIYS